MASPVLNPKQGEPPAHQPLSEASFSILSGASDKGSDPPNEKHLAPDLLNETKVNETAPSSATQESNHATALAPEEQNPELAAPPKEQNVATDSSKDTKLSEARPSATSLESNDKPATPPPVSNQELVATGDENHHIPHAIFSPGSTTGLDVDSNPTETDVSDSDSAIGNSVYSSTFSARSSVYDFVEENGRTYHRFKEGKYYLPNDEVCAQFQPFNESC